jgi:hypothetical protein
MLRRRRRGDAPAAGAPGYLTDTISMYSLASG